MTGLGSQLGSPTLSLSLDIFRTGSGSLSLDISILIRGQSQSQSGLHQAPKIDHHFMIGEGKEKSERRVTKRDHWFSSCI